MAAVPYTVVDANGIVVMYGYTDRPIHSMPLRPGQRVHPIEGAQDAYVVDGVLHQMGPQPSPRHTFDPVAKVWALVLTLVDLRADQMAAVNQAFEAASQALTAGYPASERLTWPIQQAEALAWDIDPAAPTPYLDGLAAARGIDAGLLRAKTLENVRLWMAASQQLIGRRQALRDRIDAAATVEAIQAITWEGGA